MPNLYLFNCPLIAKWCVFLSGEEFCVCVTVQLILHRGRYSCLETIGVNEHAIFKFVKGLFRTMGLITYSSSTDPWGRKHLMVTLIMTPKKVASRHQTTVGCILFSIEANWSTESLCLVTWWGLILITRVQARPTMMKLHLIWEISKMPNGWFLSMDLSHSWWTTFRTFYV